MPERLREATLALQESEERYRFLAEALPVQIWTSLPDGRLDYVTEQTARNLGLTAEKLLADGWQGVVHPDDLGGAIARWTHALATGEPYEVEFRLKLESGAWAWHLARAVAQRNGEGTIVRWFGTNTNIEEQRESARQLLEQNQLLALDAEIGEALTRSWRLSDALGASAEAVVRNLDAAFARIWTLDPAGTTLHLQASAGMYKHLDGPHSRVPVGLLKIGKIASERRSHLTNQVVGDPEVGDQVWAKREGMVSFAGFPLLLGDTLVGVIAAFARHPLSGPSLAALASVANGLALGIQRHHDHDHLVRALAERQRLLEVADDARTKAELASQAKDEFLATASHELRTPLNAILGWARLLRGPTLDAKGFQRGLETIERNAKAQVQLIEDILDGSRIISGNLHLEIQSVDLGKVVEAVMDTVRPAALARDITLEVAFDSASMRLRGDADRLQQMVWNLVNNAIKFTPKAGHVRVRVVRAGTSIELTVEDDGQGITKDFLPRLFERFHQADGTTTRRHGGLGLGLALVRHLVEAHGGSVRAESEGEGRGAKFTVTLPVQAVFPETLDSVRPAPHRDAAISEGVRGALKGVVVLVVDDELDVRELISTLLGMHGAEVVLAASAVEAFERMEERAPTVVGSDIGMPHADGYALMRQLRGRSDALGKTPALALTAYAREEDRRRAMEAGFSAYVAKPVEPEVLLRMVEGLARGSAPVRG